MWVSEAWIAGQARNDKTAQAGKGVLQKSHHGATAHCQHIGLRASPWTAGMRYRDYGSVPNMIKAAGGHTWSALHLDLTAEKIRQAQALGLQVLAWTVNEPARMAAVFDMGVNGIVTDRPDLLREEMKRRGMVLPAPTPATP